MKIDNKNWLERPDLFFFLISSTAEEVTPIAFNFHNGIHAINLPNVLRNYVESGFNNWITSEGLKDLKELKDYNAWVGGYPSKESIYPRVYLSTYLSIYLFRNPLHHCKNNENNIRDRKIAESFARKKQFWREIKVSRDGSEIVLASIDKEYDHQQITLNFSPKYKIILDKYANGVSGASLRTFNMNPLNIGARFLSLIRH